MPRISPFDVSLTPDERRALESLARKYTSPYCDVIRARIILLVAEGLSNAFPPSLVEARIAATLANTGKQVQSLFTLVHAQFALTNSLLQYVLTCVVEPPEDVLPAARARAKARYAKILRLAGQEVATRNQATLEQVLTHSK
jgi:hypothetical protein